ncbi:MAG: hypothetical protein ACLR7D_08010 [Lachnospira eligens]
MKEIASDKRYSAEQKDFLMRCMEDGFVYEEIRRIGKTRAGCGNDGAFGELL